MSEVILTNNEGVTNFERKWGTIAGVASVEEGAYLPILPVPDSWFLWVGSTHDTRIHIQNLIGEKTANVTGPIDETLNWLVEKGVIIENPASVRSYLLRYSDLLYIIPPIWKKASALLSPLTHFSLALYRDPEISDEYLTLYVRQREYQKNILDLTHLVNVECEALLSGRSGCLLTTTDFHSPK